MLTPRALLPILLVAATLAACGDDDDAPPAATRTVAERSTPPPASRGGAACRVAGDKALELIEAYSHEQRGIVAPDTASYRRQARKIIRDAKRAGCRVPTSIERQMEQFLGP